MVNSNGVVGLNQQTFWEFKQQKKNVVEWACNGHVVGYNGGNLGDM